jgi:hypothetical protein
MEVKPGKYIHFKGMEVNVIGTAFHSETMEEMVVYAHPDPVKGKPANTLFARPKAMFLEKVNVNGREVPRFRFVG